MSHQFPMLAASWVAALLVSTSPVATHAQLTQLQTFGERAALRDDSSTAAAIGPPQNLRSGALRSLVARMWQESPSFRLQCARLAAAPSLVVKLTVQLAERRSTVRAWTELSRRGGQLSLARVVIISPQDTVELVAHEIEHVIEQLDGVGVPSATSTTRHASGAAYESGRAIEMGRRVASEVRENRGRVAFVIPQGETPAGPLDGSTAGVSAGGRFIAFTSRARLAADDTNDEVDLYVLDVESGMASLESPRPGWPDRYHQIAFPRISGDGRLIVFQTLTERGPAASPWQIVLLDRGNAVPRVVSVDAQGRPANGHSTQATINADGTSILFESQSTDLGGSIDANGSTADIYMVRLPDGAVSRVSLSNDGRQPSSGHSVMPAVSTDGRYIAFTSTAQLDCAVSPCLERPPGRKPTPQVYVRDTVANTTSLVSRARSGEAPNGPSSWPAISSDGRYVAFVSEGSDLVRGDRNGLADVFVHDRLSGTTDLVSRRPDGRSGNGSSRFPAIAGDGRTIAFQSLASDLVCAKRCRRDEQDINLVWDVYVYDRAFGATLRVSADDASEWMTPSHAPSIDASAGVVVFRSRHPTTPVDGPNDDDLFVWMRGPARPWFGRTIDR
jgi:Tol biopolymer transport system component